MKKYNLITPEGMRDLLFEECGARRDIETRLMDLFRENGYHEVITPFMEFYDVFERFFPQENMYKLTDSRGRLMVMRPDSTIPIIRLAETRLKDEPRPLKLCYNQTIYNVNPKEAGRDDEIAQCGVELLGGDNADDEGVLALAVKVFKAMGTEYRFEIGNCLFFNRLTRESGMDFDTAERVRVLVETKNYPELSAMEIPDVFKQLPKLFGGAEVFDRAAGLFESEALRAMTANLRAVYEQLDGEKIKVDFGMTNTRGYYTGILFNGYAAGYGKPVLSGGKYKIGNTAATGFAVNVTGLSRIKGN